MAKMKLAFLGGSGGLGTSTSVFLQDYEVINLSSKDVDLSSKSEIEAFFNNHTDIDSLVVFSNYNYNSFFHKYSSSYEELDKQISVNIKGIAYAISCCLHNMRQRNFGRIIFASSITVDRNVMGTAVYAASKAFFENLVKTISLENASKGITANCIQLGYMDGGLTYTLSKEFIDKTIESIPAKRLGKPEEIADTIKFLINNPYINGATIKLTGGL
jgi:NAD(P)-dependent dehydrogenase (short-subunit alcohol dehydrogenase family)